ncbi:MAG: ADP-glyceromanno-heptose 6-epimerase [Chitinophagaceae bacterium]
MKKESVVIVTGAAGFIGSGLVQYLNQLGYHQLILVDDFSQHLKDTNLEGKKFLLKIERKDFFSWAESTNFPVDFVFHLGAHTDTTEFNMAIFEDLNLRYSQKIWAYCSQHQIPLVYASSAATYGGGEHGYSDDHQLLPELVPLNPYGLSKHQFDQWALQQGAKNCPPFWAGLKFFNVYGPNEYHKERMASVIFHAFNQIQTTGKVQLFRSHRAQFRDGEQMRDFIYVKDILFICVWLMEHSPASALYNIGTGKARTFYALARATFAALGQPECIEFIDIPLDIREKYQYFTAAKMDKLLQAGYREPFYSLEQGVEDYIKNYLVPGRNF